MPRDTRSVIIRGRVKGEIFNVLGGIAKNFFDTKTRYKFSQKSSETILCTSKVATISCLTGHSVKTYLYF